MYVYVTSPLVHVLYSTVGVELWNEWDSTMYEWLNIVFPSSCASMCRCWLSPRLQDRTIWGFVVPAALIIIVSLQHQTLRTCILYADLLSHSVHSSSPRPPHSHTLSLLTTHSHSHTLTLTYSHTHILSHSSLHSHSHTLTLITTLTLTYSHSRHYILTLTYSHSRHYTLTLSYLV